MPKNVRKGFGTQVRKEVQVGKRVVARAVKSNDPKESGIGRSMLLLGSKIAKLKLLAEREAKRLGQKPDRSSARAIAEWYEALLFEIGSNAVKSKRGIHQLSFSPSLRKKINDANRFGQKILSEFSEAKIRRLIRGKGPKRRRPRK